MQTPTSEAAAFPFRPWVRRTCQRAIVWGFGFILVFGVVAYLLREPDSSPLRRAFGVLGLYGTLFWLTLAKVWWTAGKPAVLVDDDAVAYQPLHLFRPRRIALDRVLSCAPKRGTHALRLVYRGDKGEEREFFLNLGVIDKRHAFLDTLGAALEERGLRPWGDKGDAWRHPAWTEAW